MSRIINLFGGPGVGKSTVASELYSMMKKNDINVELTYEFPKLIAWDNNLSAIKDQFYITANQHRNITRLYGKVDYIIVDSPIILGTIYRKKYDNNGDYPSSFYDDLDIFILSLFKKYNNINFYLKRNDTFFSKIGRLQDYDDSKRIDEEIKTTLLSNNIHFIEFDVDNNITNNIYKEIMKHA